MNRNMNCVFVNTMLVHPENGALPWEFNILPFFVVAESKNNVRIKFGWLWFYIAIIKDKE